MTYTEFTLLHSPTRVSHFPSFPMCSGKIHPSLMFAHLLPLTKKKQKSSYELYPSVANGSAGAGTRAHTGRHVLNMGITYTRLRSKRSHTT
jgi:hypothetical protein